MVTYYFIITFCQLHSTQVRRYFELHTTDTGVDYGVDILNLDENNIKIGNLVYKYRYLAYVVCPNGYRYREWRDRTNIILTIDLNTTKSSFS